MIKKCSSYLWSFLFLCLVASAAVADQNAIADQTAAFVSVDKVPSNESSVESTLPKTPIPLPLTSHIESPEMMTTEKLGQIAGGLAMIIFLIIAAAAGVKKISQGAFTGGSVIKMKGVLAVGNKEKIAVIEIENTTLVIGVTANAIQTLHVLPSAHSPLSRQALNSVSGQTLNPTTADSVNEDCFNAEESRKGSKTFSNQLRKILSQGNVEG